MARKKNTLSDSAQAMTEGLFGSPEKQDAKEAKKEKTVTGFPEGSVARSLQEEQEQALKDGRAKQVTLVIEEPQKPEKERDARRQKAVTESIRRYQEKVEALEADTAVVKKTAQNGKGKTVKATYGARISAETTIQWKAYIEASGSDAGVCTEQALREYMDRHKLTGIQKQIYDLKMQALNK